MDAFDLFRKLGSGAKFDLKRFVKDAERFKVGFNAKYIRTLMYVRLLLHKTRRRELTTREDIATWLTCVSIFH